MCEYAFKMLGHGYAALPQEGIAAIPLQLSEKLGSRIVKLNQSVVERGPHHVILENGSQYTAHLIVIALNGTGKGIITHIAVSTDANPGYSQSSESLVCVSTSHDVFTGQLIEELYSWFGNDCLESRFLENCSIPHARPREIPGDNLYGRADLQTETGHWICGDYRYSSSIQGALASGRMAGEAICKSSSVRETH